MKIKRVISAVGVSLTGLVGSALAAVNNSDVAITPDLKAGQDMFMKFSMADDAINFLNLLNYLVYFAAVCVVLYCVIIVLIAILKGNTDAKSLADEIRGKKGIKDVVIVILLMKFVLMLIDFIFSID